MYKLKCSIFLFCFFYLVYPNTSIAQVDISAQLAYAVVGPPKKAPSKRGILKVNGSASRFNPFVYVGAALLFVYQNVLSEQIQARCMYQVSCSQYTKLSIQKKGFFKGTLLGFNQISECFPGVLKEHSDYCIDQDDKINNTGID